MNRHEERASSSALERYLRAVHYLAGAQIYLRNSWQIARENLALVHRNPVPKS